VATAEEKNLAAMVQEWFDTLDNLEDIILQAADAIGHGFSCQELEWALEENVWLPSPPSASASLVPGPPDAAMNIRLNDGSIDGAELMPFGWMVHRHNAKTGFTGQSGCIACWSGRTCSKTLPFAIWRSFWRFMACRHGSEPMAGATDADKDALFEALVMLGHNAAGIIPQGTDIDFKSAASGQADPFVAMIDWCERTVSKVILGATLTSQADGKTSTNALGNVHNDVRHDILVADARQLEGFFRNMIDMLLRINGYDVSRRRLPKLVFDTRDIEEIASFSTGVKNLVESGVKSIPASWVHKKLGIPVPQKDEAVLEAPAQTGTPSPLR
jgi:phage gp29-like protein